MTIRAQFLGGPRDGEYFSLSSDDWALLLTRDKTVSFREGNYQIDLVGGPLFLEIDNCSYGAQYDKKGNPILRIRRLGRRAGQS